MCGIYCQRQKKKTPHQLCLSVQQLGALDSELLKVILILLWRFLETAICCVASCSPLIQTKSFCRTRPSSLLNIFSLGSQLGTHLKHQLLKGCGQSSLECLSQQAQNSPFLQACFRHKAGQHTVALKLRHPLMASYKTSLSEMQLVATC